MPALPKTGLQAKRLSLKIEVGEIPAVTFSGASGTMEIFDYDNILLRRMCRVESRSECDTSVVLGKAQLQAACGARQHEDDWWTRRSALIWHKTVSSM